MLLLPTPMTAGINCFIGGASASGKPADFDSAIRRFKSYRANHFSFRWGGLSLLVCLKEAETSFRLF